MTGLGVQTGWRLASHSPQARPKALEVPTGHYGNYGTPADPHGQNAQWTQPQPGFQRLRPAWTSWYSSAAPR
jgi:hypothetical protein